MVPRAKSSFASLPNVHTPAAAPQPQSTADQASSAGSFAAASRWFAEEVHPHGAQLKSYLRGSFPSVGDVDDVVQESYLRIWKARAAHPILSAKSFLFTIGRNLALDALRKKRASPIEAVGDLAALPVMEDGPSVVESVSVHEKADMVIEALVDLPPRCRKVVMLRKLKGLSQKETARRLGISEKTVEEQFTRGMKKLEQSLRRRGVSSYYDA